jgi:hypothetical protein
MSETNCQHCAAIAAGESEERIAAIFTNRMVLSVLNGAPDTAAVIGAELGQCLPCVSRLSVALLIMYSATLAHYKGGLDQAAKAIEHALAQDLDED